jgi:hypothetical protein
LACCQTETSLPMRTSKSTLATPEDMGMVASPQT